MKRLLQRLAGFWAARSLLAGGVGMILDVSCVVTGVRVLGLPPVPCVAAGATIGASLAFFLNKFFAFRDRTSRILPQAVRYAMVFGCELALHAALNNFLIHSLGVHFLVSKFTSDFVVFTCLHLLLLRFVVFVRGARAVESPGHDAVETGDRVE